MKLNGIIFDFNGTMFQDSHLHEQAWIDMIQKYSPGNGLTETEILTNVHGRTNDKILRHFVSPDLTDEEVQKLSLEKEEHYRRLCLNKPEQLVLTDGLTEVLDDLKERKLPLTIATATIKENVDFYFDTFALDRWFDPDKVVFDDGSSHAQLATFVELGQFCLAVGQHGVLRPAARLALDVRVEFCRRACAQVHALLGKSRLERL